MHKKRVQYLACFLLTLLFSQSAFADRPGSLLGSTNNSNVLTTHPDDPVGTGTLIDINPFTGVASRIGQLPLPGVSLVFSGLEGIIYGALTEKQPMPPPRSLLVTVDPTDATITPIDYFIDANNPSIEYIVTSMSFSADGELYGIATGPQLIRINTADATAIPVGSGLGIVLRNNGGMIIDDTFYVLSGSKNFEIELYAVDLDTGLASLIGPTGVQVSGVGATLGPAGEMLAVLKNTLYVVDINTGGVTPIGGANGFDGISALTFVDTIQLECPCLSDDHETHGAYMSCVIDSASEFVGEEINRREFAAIVRDAAQSGCGK